MPYNIINYKYKNPYDNINLYIDKYIIEKEKENKLVRIKNNFTIYNNEYFHVGKIECPICLDDKNIFYKYKCSHNICKDCLTKMLFIDIGIIINKNITRCGICRELDDDLIPGGYFPSTVVNLNKIFTDDFNYFICIMCIKLFRIKKQCSAIICNECEKEIE